MGDHRASCSIKFEFHGKLYEISFDWLNWSPNEDGIDHRVVEFFRQAHNDGMHRYHEGLLEVERGREEDAERALYEKLKQKYETE